MPSFAEARPGFTYMKLVEVFVFKLRLSLQAQQSNFLSAWMEITSVTVLLTLTTARIILKGSL